MATKVICPKCGIRNDRDKVVGFSINRRYYCEACYERKLLEIAEEERTKAEKKKFADSVCHIFGLRAPGPLIYSQRKRLREEQGYTDDDIIDTLEYIYHVKQCKKTTESLGLVPYMFEEAQKAKKRREAQGENLDKSLQNLSPQNPEPTRQDVVRKKEKVSSYDFEEAILRILKEEE